MAGVPPSGRLSQPDREIAEAGFGDLAVGLLDALDPKRAHHIQSDMVPSRDPAVEVETVEARRLGQCDAGLLGEFARQRLQRRLANLDAAARKLPARHIGMPDEKHLARLRQNRRPYPEGDAACQPEIEMQQAHHHATPARKSRFLASPVRGAPLLHGSVSHRQVNCLCKKRMTDTLSLGWF